MARRILGLDLGSNSIGWALLDLNEEDTPVAVAAAGVRVFPAGVDRTPQGTEKSRNAQRREARGARRQHQRRNRRREKLRRLLQRSGLLPSDTTELHELFGADPYDLRRRGLAERLEPYELGRALYQLAQRRGFKSNRKLGRKQEDGIVKKGIGELESAIETANAPTLGAYLASLDRATQRIRARYTSREMYEREFASLWTAQSENYPELLTPTLRESLHHAIFWQRPLRVQKHTVGSCEYEKDKKRSARGTWHAQQCRLLQEVNNLTATDSMTGEVISFGDGDLRKRLLDVLQTKRQVNFDAVRKILKLGEQWRFNLEVAGRKSLKGNGTEWHLRTALKKTYNELGNDVRDEIVHDLLFVEDEEVIRRHATERWRLRPEEVNALVNRDLEAGYFHLSHKAIRKLLPFLEAGLGFTDAVSAAGYARRDERDVRRAMKLERHEDLRNPAVNRALSQLRLVVNTIVEKHGSPSLIRVELARDLKVPKRVRAEMRRRNAENRRRNEAVEARLRDEFGIASPSRDDVTKVKLWDECKYVCPYTGRAIPKDELFATDNWDVEHIHPYSRCLDDSYMNKTLCWAAENRAVKRNRTPREAYGSDGERWDAIAKRIQTLPWPKRRRFLSREVELDDFVSRQLNDTRYISRQARAYLEPIVGKNKVQVATGQTTALLRRLWGLNSILGEGEQKTRDDHRHHAIDATVVALTTPGTLQAVSNASARGGLDRIEEIAAPWEGFRAELSERIGQIVVSHRAQRRVRGALHEETNYGILQRVDEKGDALFAVRKPVASLSRAALDRVADPVVRSTVEEHLAAHGVDLKKDKETSKSWKTAMEKPIMLVGKSGARTPIRRVRLHVPSTGMRELRRRAPEGVGEVYRAVKTGSNHHMIIFEERSSNGNRRWGGKVVSRFEAVQRVRRGVAPVSRDLHDDGRFVMSLSIGDMLKLRDESIWRVQKLDAGNTRLTLRLHTATTIEDRTTGKTVTPNALRQLTPRKIQVTPVGEVLEVHD